MRHKLRRLVPWPWAVFAAAVYSATYSVDILSIRLRVALTQQIVKPRLVLLMILAGLYAIRRVLCFHPMYDRGYLGWLTISPWDNSRPFPLGPPHIVSVDIVVVGILTLLAYFNGLFSPVGPAIAFLSVYLVLWGLALGFTPEHFWYTLVAILVAPLAIYPHRDPRFALAVLVGLYLWLYIGFRQQFKGFPWNTGYWKADSVEALRKGFAKKEMIGWRYQMLKLYDPEIKMSVPTALIISALLTWWLHVGLWFVREPDELEALRFIVYLGIAVLIFARIAVYMNPGYRAPISFWGRLFIFRWIIPRYHIVYVAPICMVTVLVMMLALGRLLGLPIVYRYELLVFIEVLLALSLPPRLVDWRLTGAHRMVEKPKRTASR